MVYRLNAWCQLEFSSLPGALQPDCHLTKVLFDNVMYIVAFSLPPIEVEEDKGEGCWSPTKMAAGTPKATPDNSAETIAATDSSASTSDTPTITSPMVSELAHVMVKEEEDRKRRDGNDGQWLRSLIEDEQEPTVMFEAEEFSLFEPTHLMTYMNSDSYLQRESDGGNETLSKVASCVGVCLAAIHVTLCCLLSGTGVNIPET